MTGYAMANHGQHLEFSTDVHKLFGWSLMSAGFARIIEVCFVLRDSASDNVRPRAFQHLPPYLLVLSGLTFLSATEEQMQWIAGSGMDSTTYANILFSGAFAIYLVGNALLELYIVQAAPRKTQQQQDQHAASAIGLAASSEEEANDRAGLRDDEEDVENAAASAAAMGGGRRYRPAAGMTDPPSPSSSPIMKRLAHAVPATLAGLAGTVASVVRSLDNAASSSSSPSSSRLTSAGDRDMSEYYESLPLTNRDSVDHGHTLSSSSSAPQGDAQHYSNHMNGIDTRSISSNHAGVGGGRIANGRRADQARAGAGASAIDETQTVFDIGDFGEDDDGGDGYWQDDDEDDDKEGVEGIDSHDSNGERVEGRARSSRHTLAAASSTAQGVHRTARVT